MRDDLPGPREAADLPRIIDEDTGEEALDVDFTKPVNHPTNVSFLKRIVEIAQTKTKVSLENLIA